MFIDNFPKRWMLKMLRSVCMKKAIIRAATIDAGRSRLAFAACQNAHNKLRCGIMQKSKGAMWWVQQIGDRYCTRTSPFLQAF